MPGDKEPDVLKPVATVQHIRFIREQKGAVESRFTAALVPVLREKVGRAYLALVSYESDPAEHVALCLAADGEHAPLVEAVHNVFKPMFGPNVHLDILFLSPKQEATLKTVCAPFLEQGARPGGTRVP